MHTLEHFVHHPFKGCVVHNLASGVQAAFTDQISAAEVDRVEGERTRHHVHVALVGPRQLGYAKPT